MDAFEAYALYMGIRLHFEGTYDFFKYGGKTSVRQESFLKRKDRFAFHKLAQKYTKEEYIDFLVSNLMDRKIHWGNALLEKESEKFYINYLKRQQTISYQFKNDIDILFGKVPKFTDLFKRRGAAYPIILEAYYQEEINLETLIILDKILQYSDKFDKELGENEFVWREIKFKMKKLQPFLQYDMKNLRKILRQEIEDRKEL